MEHLHFPNESAEYRRVRNALLEEEMALRRQVERVAAQRRALPLGGAVPEDYVFMGPAGPVRLSHLFDGHDTLAIYSFMFGPERERPCPGCTHFLDGLDGATPHIVQRTAFVVVAKSPIERLIDLARERHWRHLNLYSTKDNAYDRDYFGDSSALSRPIRRQQEFEDGKEWDMPILNVFKRDGDAIRHFWGSELLYVPPEPGQEYRHNDLLDPVWNMFDVTPDGRGNFHPKLEYR
jgi:predicted dithiol-disulfide oxidoreductase (DUF899 family)